MKMAGRYQLSEEEIKAIEQKRKEKVVASCLKLLISLCGVAKARQKLSIPSNFFVIKRKIA